MRFIFNLLALSLTLVGLKAQTMVDGCPKEDIACLDVINSSQCLEQLIIEHDATVTKDAMIKCVDTEGASSNMTGSAKLCHCPGCHSAPINAAIVQMFPPPCA